MPPSPALTNCLRKIELAKLTPNAFLGEAGCLAAALQALKQEPGEASSRPVVQHRPAPARLLGENRVRSFWRGAAPTPAALV